MAIALIIIEILINVKWKPFEDGHRWNLTAQYHKFWLIERKTYD